MNKLVKGVTYTYNRNIGWQDRTIRTIFGILAMAGAIYFYSINVTVSAILSLIFIAQAATVLSARCIICYFMGVCTITAAEKRSLDAKDLQYEK